ncbi:DNA repair protein RecN [Acidaminococcus provencensis]|uniref:DNA repair protein RecN n=1 Tax=Acidaminococcus provencensis TaxID=2058289 RepID=UPI000CF986F3|nr:DNA repair protein RecN [Acidaminococcus provencensis]
MLTSLEVHNFALIDHLRVDFTPGFNVFTGETGAGKSILIDAFSIVLGSRASVDYLRQGDDAYWIQAVFDIEDQPGVQAILKELDMDAEDGMLFLRRKVTAQGKSQAFVNERQVPVHVLSRLASQLADIHGQHENQTLLAAGAALNILDSYDPGIGPLLKDYQDSYRQWQQADQELQRWLKKDSRQTEDLERLEGEIKEIEDAHIQLGEDETLRTQVKKLLNQEKILEAVGEAYHYLNGSEEESSSVLDSLNAALGSLDRVLEYAPELSRYREAMDSSWQVLEDVRQSLGDLLSSDPEDREQLAQAQERLDLLYRLKQKYGGSLEKVLAYQEAAQTEYQGLLSLESTIRNCRKKADALRQELERKAEALTVERKKAGESLCKALLPHIHDLAMPQGRVEIGFTKLSHCGLKGQDEAVFLFSANAGMPVKPLARIASGGELSRFALALKTVMLRNFGVPTMIFDEIDTGVGGVTAQKMAEKMALIAGERQVLCITHLAQIACFADHHLYIHKSTAGSSTTSQVEALDQEGRIQEIMRMTGGTNQSQSARENARELLAMAAAVKKQNKEPKKK